MKINNEIAMYMNMYTYISYTRRRPTCYIIMSLIITFQYELHWQYFTEEWAYLMTHAPLPTLAIAVIVSVPGIQAKTLKGVWANAVEFLTKSTKKKNLLWRTFQKSVMITKWIDYNYFNYVIIIVNYHLQVWEPWTYDQCVKH